MMSHSQRIEDYRRKFWRKQLVSMDAESCACPCIHGEDGREEPSSVSYRCHCHKSAPTGVSTSLQLLLCRYPHQRSGCGKALIWQKKIKHSGRASQNVSIINQGSKNSFYKIRKYLKTGALAQMPDIQNVSMLPSTAMSRKKIVAENREESDKVSTNSRAHLALSPLTTPESSAQRFGPAYPRRKTMLAPRTPMSQLSTAIALEYGTVDAQDKAVIENLPLDILVRIMCFLHHDQLKPIFHVCKRFCHAVVIARQIHFNFKTPNRERQERLSLVTPKPDQQWPFISLLVQPPAPNAPRHSSKPRISLGDMRRIAATLFRGSSSQIPLRPPRMAIRSMTSHRVLFSEEELCQAVAHNSL